MAPRPRPRPGPAWLLLLPGPLARPAAARRGAAGFPTPVLEGSLAAPAEVRERPLAPFGAARYPDWPPRPTWGDLSAHGRHGATCDADGDSAAQCGLDLVCRKGICRHCVADKECPSLHRCLLAPRGDGGRCVPIGKRAWEQVFTDRFEALCTVITFFAAALAAAAGMGGGGMFMPLLTSLSGLKPEQAAPLSQVMILSGSLVNISVFLAQRHPKHCALPVIDYDCVVLLSPMLFLGVTFGVLVNQVSPQWLLLVNLALCLGFSFWRSGSKGLQQLRSERPAVLAPLPSSDTPRPVDHVGVFMDLTNRNAWQVVGTVSVWLVMLLSSGHGFAVCSARFAAFLAVQAALLVGCTAAAAIRIARATPPACEAQGGDAMPRWVSRASMWHAVRFPLAGFGAGFLGGLLGLGGGIIMSVVLLEVGMHSEAIQATTVVFVLLSSSLATIQFAVLGQHVWDYALWYCGVTVAATLLGQHLCEAFVRKSGRYSLITLAIAGVLGASLLGLLVVGCRRVADDLALGRQMWFSARGLCSGGGLGIVVADVLPAQGRLAEPIWRG